MKRKQKAALRSSARSRQTRLPVNESFRRNVVVFSRAQKEIARNQQSVTQRQIERKRSDAKKRLRYYVLGVIGIAAFVMIGLRMIPTSVELTTNASVKLSKAQTALYKSDWMKQYKQIAPLGQYWLMDESQFENEILQLYPEVEDITVNSSVPFGRDIEINVKYRQAVFTWRDATGELQFVDKNGVLFSKDLDASVDVKKLINIEDQSGTVLDPGNSVLTTHLVKFVGQMHDKIKTVYPGKVIAKVIIPISTREVQIQVADNPYIIKFSSERDLSEQVNELGLLVNNINAQNIKPTAYIDIRIPSKAFYK